MDDKEISVPCNVVCLNSHARRKVGISGRADDANTPDLPTVDGMTEHLFEYSKERDGSAGHMWAISVWAENEADARDRLRRAAEGQFIGICAGREEA